MPNIQDVDDCASRTMPSSKLISTIMGFAAFPIYKTNKQTNEQTAVKTSGIRVLAHGYQGHIMSLWFMEPGYQGMNTWNMGIRV